VESGGTHSPGLSPGTQDVAGSATYNTGSIFTWELTDNTTGDTTKFDRVVGNGTGALTVQSGAIFNVVLNDTGSGVLFSNGFWSTNRSWEVFSGFTSVAGLFQLGSVTLDSIGNSYIPPYPSGGTFTFRSSGGSLYADWSAVPEPTSALAGILLGAGLLRRRRSPRVQD